MATTSNAGTFKTRFSFPVGAGRTDTVCIANSITSTTVINDVWRLCSVPKGITFFDAFVQNAALDSNATPLGAYSLYITDGTTIKVLIAGTTSIGTGGLYRAQSAPATATAIGWTTDNSSYQIHFKQTAAAATAVTSAAVNVVVTVGGNYVSGAITNE